ncbi:MAG: DUF4422 domain-containing protein [Lachnospiraceae bacterium]|nr:DUF4422 domain-containing protein [Lachnospiraceae bacterium]
MSITVYVCTHKKAPFPADAVYHPLHVGRAASCDLGYDGDDTGENISAKNNRYGELTGLYWIWKNSPEWGYVGLCHYRRYFLNNDGEILTGAEFETLLSDTDVIVSKEIDARMPYLAYYNEAHDPRQQELVREAIFKTVPEYLDIYDEVMGQPFYHYGNLCVMRRELLNDYCAWLFAILTYVEERLDVSGYDAYHARVYGFLSEQLLRVWIAAHKLSFYACPIGITSEKAETKEFKLAMGQLVKMGQVEQARQMFAEVLRVRPDIALELSDISGEIPVIGCVLNILAAEGEAGRQNGLYAYTKDLPTMVEHVKKLTEIVAAHKEHSRDAREYMKRTYVTDAALSSVRSQIRNSP